MGNSARYGWPWPEGGDPPNISLYTKNLANAVESTVGVIDDTVSASRVLSNTPVTTNSASTSGTGRVIWVARQVALVAGKVCKVTFDTGYDAAAVSTVVFEMHYIVGTTATLTGATKFYGRYGRALQGGAFLSASGSDTFVVPSSNTFTVMGVLWNSDSSVSKTNGGTPNATDNQGKFRIELA